MKTVHVSAAIIHNGDAILACKRSDEHMSGWEFPGGKVKPDEKPEQTCLREVKEELDVELGSIFYYDTVEYDYPDFHLSMDVFICQLGTNQTPTARVHSELRWLSRNELLDVPWLAADTELVRGLGVMWEQLFWAEHL